jgi:hypothetical protein
VVASVQAVAGSVVTRLPVDSVADSAPLKLVVCKSLSCWYFHVANFSRRQKAFFSSDPTLCSSASHFHLLCLQIMISTLLVMSRSVSPHQLISFPHRLRSVDLVASELKFFPCAFADVPTRASLLCFHFLHHIRHLACISASFLLTPSVHLSGAFGGTTGFAGGGRSFSGPAASPGIASGFGGGAGAKIFLTSLPPPQDPFSSRSLSVQSLPRFFLCQRSANNLMT